MSESNTKVQVKAENPVKGDSKQKPKKSDSKGHQEGGKIKLTAPELPGSMKYMLMDEKDEDSNLKAIRITFYRRNVTESEFQVPDRVTKQLVWLRPSEYDAYKEVFRAKKKQVREAEAGHGWAKKLAHRALIFAKPDSDVDLIAMMNHTPVPKIVVGMMSLTQQEFSAKFPTPDSVLDYWWSTNNHAEADAIVEYAKALKCDFVLTLQSLKEAQRTRAEKKSEKISKAVVAAATKKSETLVPPGVSWGEFEQDATKRKGPKMEVTPPKGPDQKKSLIEAISFLFSGKEISRAEKNKLNVAMLSVLPDGSFDELKELVAGEIQESEDDLAHQEVVTLVEKFLASREGDQKG